MKVVRHAIWGPVIWGEVYRQKERERKAGAFGVTGRPTYIFDVDCALFSKTGVIYSQGLFIRNNAAIATFGDSQTINGYASFSSDFFV